ncbi:cation transporter [Burkholderia multivorans]|uniref:Cation transporter n=1 Tax=Burkholderia multivorans TaxID=87883 RepID=A0AB37AUC4_9BURK|nr:cation transporter [Burkholderia multivorans]PRE45422.1 hypothetical protein C6P99_19145 [Burkholderia multivorans]PRE52109.1 hypothetical protein C6P97_07360 [Burkholderia multivorans]
MTTASPQCDTAPPRDAHIGVLAGALLMTLQLGIGWLSRSHAIIADGTHTFIDLIVDCLLYASLHPRARRFMKIRRVRAAWASTALCTLLSAVAGAGFVVQGFASEPARAETLTHGTAAAAPGWAILTALLVLVIRGYAARRLGSAAEAIADTDSGAAGILAAGAWHARIDALSACVAAAGAVGMAAGLGDLDQIATALIGSIMLSTAVLQRNGPVRCGLARLAARVRRRLAAHHA